MTRTEPLALALLLSLSVHAEPLAPDAETLARGEALYHQAGCVGCHSPPGADRPPLSGGRDNPTIFGTFYAPNISPDPVDGIGGWTEADFFRAMREGRAPDGRRYWPTFAYMAFTKMSDEDIHALWTWLSSQPAVKGTVPENEPRYPEAGLRFWRAFAFEPGPLEPDPTQSEQWNRGRYLTQAVGYCDQCHSPRGRTGFIKRGKYMGGGANPGKQEIHPNLTPDPEHGLADWSAEEIARFLGDGVKPGGDRARTDWVMHEKIVDSYSWWSEEDRLAIGVYVTSLPPVDFDPERFYADW
ncbi:MAG: cytochrome c [Alphaproteobacteria bacterium]|nr:cytochrome c [Alphaproteobacteria bacterium]MCB9795314.1 cytochrome c [Alphaproteobacteria bacterium]